MPPLLAPPSPSGYDYRRTLKAFMWNAVIYTPLGHHWYCTVLPRVFARAANGGTGTLATAGKVALDQTVFGPLVIAGYMTYSTVTRGGDWAAVKARFNEAYTDILVANWMVWPALQMINLKFVPLQLQILVMNTAVVGWSTFLALSVSKSAVPVDGAAAKPDAKALNANAISTGGDSVTQNVSVSADTGAAAENDLAPSTMSVSVGGRAVALHQHTDFAPVPRTQFEKSMLLEAAAGVPAGAKALININSAHGHAHAGSGAHGHAREFAIVGTDKIKSK